jgi:hypothetical protein
MFRSYLIAQPHIFHTLFRIPNITEEATRNWSGA